MLIGQEFRTKTCPQKSETSILTLRMTTDNIRFHLLSQNKRLSLLNRWYSPVISIKVRRISSVELPETIPLYWGQAPKPPILSFLLNYRYVCKTWFLLAIFAGIPSITTKSKRGSHMEIDLVPICASSRPLSKAFQLPPYCKQPFSRHNFTSSSERIYCCPRNSYGYFMTLNR